MPMTYPMFHFRRISASMAIKMTVILRMSIINGE